MEKIVISSESSLDLKKDEALKYHIHIIPYTLLFGEESALDGEFGAKDIFAYTKKTGKLAKTSAINAEEYKKRFADLLKDHDYLIHFSIGAKISSTYEHALEAAEAFARTEGILPAPESSHAIRAAIDEALKCKETGEEKTILFGLTGTGYFDLVAYEKFHDGKMDDYIPTDDELAAFRARLPQV